MPRPAGWTPTTPIDDVNLNANTKDVIGDLNSLNKIHFPDTDLVSAINAVPNMMSKTFYVDAVNGDDVNGDGSSTAPFATLKKAVDSVPIGAKAVIYVKGDVVIDQDIGITGKYIRVIGQDYDTANLVATQTIQNSTTADAKIIVSYGVGFMHLDGFDITANDGGNSVSQWSTFFKCYHGFFSITLGAYPKPFNINVNYPLANCEEGLCHIHIRQATINTTLTATTPLLAKYNNGLFIYSENAITDNTGGIITRPAVGTIY